MAKQLIIFTPGASSGGGIHSVVSDQISYLQRKNISFKVVETSGRTFFLKIFRVIFCLLFLFKCFILKKETLCIFHVASANSFYRKYLIIFFAKKMFGFDYYIHLHGGMFKKFFADSSNSFKFRIVRMFNDSNGTIVLSKSWKDWVESICDFRNVYVVPNSINVDPNIKEDDVKQYVRDIDILFVGRVEPAKGIHELFQAVSNEFFFQRKIILVGRVCHDFKHFTAADNILMLGQKPREDVLALMRRAKVLVLPSHYEAFPVVILEAMYNGAICICSNVGSVPEIISDTVNGFLFPVKNVEKLEEKLSQALSNYKELSLIRSCAFNDILKNYSLDNNMDMLISIYFSK